MVSHFAQMQEISWRILLFSVVWDDKHQLEMMKRPVFDILDATAHGVVKARIIR